MNRQVIDFTHSEGIEGILPYPAFRACACAYTSYKGESLRSLRTAHDSGPGRALSANGVVPVGDIRMREGAAHYIASVRAGHA